MTKREFWAECFLVVWFYVFALAAFGSAGMAYHWAFFLVDFPILALAVMSHDSLARRYRQRTVDRSWEKL